MLTVQIYSHPLHPLKFHFQVHPGNSPFLQTLRRRIMSVWKISSIPISILRKALERQGSILFDDPLIKGRNPENKNGKGSRLLPFPCFSGRINRVSCAYIGQSQNSGLKFFFDRCSADSFLAIINYVPLEMHNDLKTH